MLTATQIVKNKFWIVEKDGEKVATIQTSMHGVSFVRNEHREYFPSIKLLKSKYNITFRAKEAVSPAAFAVHSYPCDHFPHNALFDNAKKLPLFTRSMSSKCVYCAGHYLVKINEVYEHLFCPKLITLNRNEYIGPFQTTAEISVIQTFK